MIIRKSYLSCDALRSKNCTQNIEEDSTLTKTTVQSIRMWETPNEPYQPYSFTGVAFTLHGGPNRVPYGLTTQLYAICRLRWLMGQRVWVRRGKRGRDARWIAQPSSEQDGEHHSSSLLIAAIPRPSAILERGKSVSFLSPSLTTWHSFGKASAAVL